MEEVQQQSHDWATLQPHSCQNLTNCRGPKLNNANKNNVFNMSSKKRQFSGKERTRELVRQRDNHTCQDCGYIRTRRFVDRHNQKIRGLKGKIKSLDVHHLEGLCGQRSQKYDRICDMDILVTLCHKCHYSRPEHKVNNKRLCTCGQLVDV